MAISGTNLKVVIKNNGTWLLNAFKKDIVRYSNHLWQADIITPAVKDKITGNTDIDLAASNLVSRVSNAFEAFSTPNGNSKQIECMGKLLRSLESEGEIELAEGMRSELHTSCGINIPSTYGNPSSDQARQSPHYPHSEPVDMMYYSNEEYAYEESVFDMDSGVVEPAHRFVVMPPVRKSSPYGQRRNMVFPSDQSNPHQYDRNSDPAPYPPRRNSAMYSSGKGRRATLPKFLPPTTSQYPKLFPGSGSPMYSVLESDYDGSQQNRLSETSSHQELQNNSIRIRKNEEELKELKIKLEDRDKEIETLHQEHKDQLQRQLEKDNHEKLMQKLEMQQQLEKDNHEKILQKLSEIELKLSRGNEKVYVKMDEELNVFKKTMFARQRSNEGSVLNEMKSFQEIMLSKWKAQDSRFNARFKAEQLVCSVCVVLLIVLFAIIVKLLWK